MRFLNFLTVILCLIGMFVTATITLSDLAAGHGLDTFSGCLAAWFLGAGFWASGRI